MAGGGTAGHVVPAVAIARTLTERHGPGSVELVGARRGLEARTPLVGDLPLTLLPGRGLQRRWNGEALVANARAAAEVASATVAAAAIVARRRPSVVVAVGGYASVPVAMAAVALGVPVVVVNVDAVPGLSNRLVAPLARACAVAAAGTALPRAVVTGAPVRPEVVAIAGTGRQGPSGEARRALGLPEDRRVVAVVGGSLGAKRINEATLQLAARWAHRTDVAVHHVVGQRDAAWAAESRSALPAGVGRGDRGLWYRQVAYEERMPLVYQAADVLVGRAGAMTVAELAVAGVPSVLVPLPGAPGAHQDANAAVLADAGAAVVVPDARCDGATLADVLQPLVGDPDRRRTMAEAAARLGRPDAALTVSSLAEAHARPPRGRSGGRW